MIPLLEHPLIKKYFKCDRSHTDIGENFQLCSQVMAYRILQAMCETVKKGEKLLVLGNIGDMVVTTAMNDYPAPNWGALRLPDQFQPKECPNVLLQCSNCGKRVLHDEKCKPPTCPTCDPWDCSCPKPKPEKCKTHDSILCGCGSLKRSAPASEVEKKIAYNLEWARCQSAREYKSPWLEGILNDLVALARREK